MPCSKEFLLFLFDLAENPVDLMIGKVDLLRKRDRLKPDLGFGPSLLDMDMGWLASIPCPEIEPVAPPS
jgi:hypothetical protein